jgi:tRNA 2-selenouridine synthase
MTLKKITVERFLELAEYTPVCDVRSPLEYNNGHIPGAINIPLFNDKEREEVGIKYHKEGRIHAILEGLKQTSPSLLLKLQQAMKISTSGNLLVHCWRGGMRSEAMAWLFSLADIDVEVLDGGYKSYRRYIIKRIAEKRKMIILGGMTGCSKTHILEYLKVSGQQVLDLEGLANHKGSAFGSLGQHPQPTTEQFANILFNELKKTNRDLPLWVEDESRNIGSVFMPDRFFLNMQDAPAIILKMDVKTRLPRLIEEYSGYPEELLKASVLKISKRLGGDNTRETIEAIEAGDFAQAIEITLNYYDKAYLFGLKKKHFENTIYVETNVDDIGINAMKVLEAAGKITW